MKHLSLCAVSLSVLLLYPVVHAQYIPLPTDVQPGTTDANVKLPEFDVSVIALLP